MGNSADEFVDKAGAVRELLAAQLVLRDRLAYANSLGAEAMVLTDIIWTHFPQIDVFTMDTGRLHEETYALLDRLQQRYGRRMRVLFPEPRPLERLVTRNGVNGFYKSLEARLECCRVRKVEPFRRAIAGFAGWITGIRREQSQTRAHGTSVQWDAEHGLYKISPLIDWSEDDIWHYIRQHKLPYNPLHDRRFPSIGCSPCTRAIQPGESRRAGRWWWEKRPETNECGLHPRLPGTPPKKGAETYRPEAQAATGC